MVESLRWVDVQLGGTLAGHGTVKADLFSKGTLALNLDKPLVVHGAVNLSGKLSLSGAGKVNGGESITVLQAKSISGGFANNDVLLDGKSYSIFYTPTEISVRAK